MSLRDIAAARQRSLELEFQATGVDSDSGADVPVANEAGEVEAGLLDFLFGKGKKKSGQGPGNDAQHSKDGQPGLSGLLQPAVDAINKQNQSTGGSDSGFVESDHPRGPDGRFTQSPDTGTPSTTSTTAGKPVVPVTKPPAPPVPKPPAPVTKPPALPVTTTTTKPVPVNPALPGYTSPTTAPPAPPVTTTTKPVPSNPTSSSGYMKVGSVTKTISVTKGTYSVTVKAAPNATDGYGEVVTPVQRTFVAAGEGSVTNNWVVTADNPAVDITVQSNAAGWYYSVTKQ